MGSQQNCLFMQNMPTYKGGKVKRKRHFICQSIYQACLSDVLCGQQALLTQTYPRVHWPFTQAPIDAPPLGQTAVTAKNGGKTRT